MTTRWDHHLERGQWDAFVVRSALQACCLRYACCAVMRVAVMTMNLMRLHGIESGVAWGQVAVSWCAQLVTRLGQSWWRFGWRRVWQVLVQRT